MPWALAMQASDFRYYPQDGKCVAEVARMMFLTFIDTDMLFPRVT